MKGGMYFFLVCVLCGISASSTVLAAIPAPNFPIQADTDRTERIRLYFQDTSSGAQTRPDFPIQDFYIPPRVDAPLVRYGLQDSTPPSDPIIEAVHIESIYSAFVEWTASEDPESGIDLYAVGFGSAPGEADINWWQSTGTNTVSYPRSMAALGIAEGDTFYFSVYARNGAGLQSNIVSSDPVWFEWEELGNESYELTVAYADSGYDETGSNVIAGWDSAQVAYLDHFVSRVNPIIKEIYGPPSRPYTVTIVKNLYYTNSAVFFPGSNEIHIFEDVSLQLLTHELIHAYRDNVILSSDDDWRYHPQLSGFEEGFAQGVSYVCMNRYIELYPNDEVVDPTYLYGSSKEWEYDFQNVENITTEDLWSSNSLGIHWVRYELAAAAMRKMHLEDPTVFRNFNEEYYERLNSDHALRTSRDLAISVLEIVLPEIEGQTTLEWIDKQRVFDCRIIPGRKIWIWTQHYPWWQEYLIRQRTFYYETFGNGSDWAYWDGSQWVYHNLNGSVGLGSIYTSNDSLFWQDNLLIEPVENPPEWYGIGTDYITLSTDSDAEPWPGGDPSDFVFNMTDMDVYRFDAAFDTTSASVYRVIGADMRGLDGVAGAILNDRGGHIYIDHEEYPEEGPIPVVNGTFRGARQWASVPNPRTGGTDSQPGRVSIRYVASDGVQYFAKRNIDWGSFAGNQLLLFDTEKMQYATPVSTPAVDPIGIAAVMVIVLMLGALEITRRRGRTPRGAN